MLILTLASTRKGVAIFDKVFITEYIRELLRNTSKRILYFDRLDGYGIKLLVADKKVMVPEELKKEVQLLAFNRNAEIEEMNNKQYKLEGIKWKN